MKRSSLRLSSCSNSPSSSSPKKETITKKGKKIFLSEDDDSLTFLSSSWDQMWTVEGDGFIKSIPYTFTHLAGAKQRWLGRGLGDVLIKEFHDRPSTYYLEAIKAGLIRINGEEILGETAIERLIKDGDFIQHSIHRHEPPILNWEEESSTSFPKINILYHDKERGFMAVNKPPGLPVHPTGRYRRNTLISLLLKQEFNTLDPLQKLSPINRLDRLTSGVCMIATNSVMAKEMHKKMEGGQYFRKEYIARVKGEFKVSNTDLDGFMRLDLPLGTVEHKLGLVFDDPINGKESTTLFKALGKSINGESLVLCRPLTGRTHQIRVHLRYLGFPISNDPLYGDLELWKQYSSSKDEDEKKSHLMEISFNLLEMLKKRDHSSSSSSSSEGVSNTRQSDDSIINLCPECNSDNTNFLPPKEDMLIYLHAFKYSSPEHCFEAKPFPSWVIPFDFKCQ